MKDKNVVVVKGGKIISGNKDGVAVELPKAEDHIVKDLLADEVSFDKKLGILLNEFNSELVIPSPTDRKTLACLECNVVDWIVRHYLTMGDGVTKEFVANTKTIVRCLKSHNYQHITFSSKEMNKLGVPLIVGVSEELRSVLPPRIVNSIERNKLRNTIDNWKSGKLLEAPTNFQKTDSFVAQKYLDKQLDCAKRGIEMHLTFSEMKTLIKRTYCYYSGVKLVEGTNHRVTLDRINCDIGYTKENTVACSYAVNQFKNIMLESKDLFKDSNMSQEHIKTMLSKFVELM